MNYRYIVSGVFILLGLYAIIEASAPIVGIPLIGIGLFVIIWALLKIAIMLGILTGVVYLAYEAGAFEVIEHFIQAL